MRVKQFKTIDEQIQILKEKGLIINDVAYAKSVLLRENYFFLNGYRHLLVKSNTDRSFIAGSTFEELYSIFMFDRQLRNIMFKHILIVENNLKSIISYQLSKRYGYKEKDYLKAKNFNTDPNKYRQVSDIIKKMKRQIRTNARQHSATMHYISNYGYIPMWVLVKVLSFGLLSEMFAVLKPEDKEDIASVYELNSETLDDMLPILANYRNLCAHEDILYDNRTQRQLNSNYYHEILNIEKLNDEYIYGKNDLFALLIILKQMLTEEEFKNLSLEIEHIIDNLNYNLNTIKVDKVLDRMGFPMNWKDIVEVRKGN